MEERLGIRAWEPLARILLKKRTGGDDSCGMLLRRVPSRQVISGERSKIMVERGQRKGEWHELLRLGGFEVEILKAARCSVQVFSWFSALKMGK